MEKTCSRTTLLAILLLAASCFFDAKIAQGAIFLPCKSNADCAAIHCPTGGPAHCAANHQCSCDSFVEKKTSGLTDRSETMSQEFRPDHLVLCHGDGDCVGVCGNYPGSAQLIPCHCVDNYCVSG